MVTYILRSSSPRFHGPVILPYILNTIYWINVTLGILLQFNIHIDRKRACDLGATDVYFSAVISGKSFGKFISLVHYQVKNFCLKQRF